MTPSPSLVDKIKSKLDVAKVLGAVLAPSLAAAIGLSQGNPSHDPYPLFHQIAFWLSIGLLAISMLLYFATVYSYDQLLMPREFWKKKKYDESRLFELMIKVWQRLFIPATAALGLGLLAFAIAKLKVAPDVAALISFGLLLAAVIASRLRPKVPIEWDRAKRKVRPGKGLRTLRARPAGLR